MEPNMTFSHAILNKSIEEFMDYALMPHISTAVEEKMILDQYCNLYVLISKESNIKRDMPFDLKRHKQNVQDFNVQFHKQYQKLYNAIKITMNPDEPLDIRTSPALSGIIHFYRNTHLQISRYF